MYYETNETNNLLRIKICIEQPHLKIVLFSSTAFFINLQTKQKKVKLIRLIY